MIGSYQHAVSQFMDTLINEELEEADQLTEDWNNSKPPLEVQAEWVI